MQNWDAKIFITQILGPLQTALPVGEAIVTMINVH